jgi:hypothetical protein
MAKKINVANYHSQYQSTTTQHWDAKSESFAGGDNLMTALSSNWEIERCRRVRHAYDGARYVKLYEFYLVRDDEKLTMPVLENPYIVRFIADNEIPLEEADNPPA